MFRWVFPRTMSSWMFSVRGCNNFQKLPSADQSATLRAMTDVLKDLWLRV